MRLNVTQVLAQKSGKHPKTVIGIWALILVISLVMVAFMLTDTLTTETTFSETPESVQADNLLNKRLNQDDTDEINEMVIIKSDTISVDDPAFQTYTNDIYNQLMGLRPDVVLSGVNYYQNPNETLVSKDRHALIIP